MASSASKGPPPEVGCEPSRPAPTPPASSSRRIQRRRGSWRAGCSSFAGPCESVGHCGSRDRNVMPGGQDRVVVVTGAGGGLGREYALTPPKEGARVVGND